MACLRSERRQRSAALQRRLFDQFTLLNAKGERKSLHDIFIQDFEKYPPQEPANVLPQNCFSKPI